MRYNGAQRRCFLKINFWKTLIFFLLYQLQPAWAQEPDHIFPIIILSGDSVTGKEIPRVELSSHFGREGPALGEGLLLQFNIGSWAIGPFIGFSFVNGYDAGNGINADLRSLSAGVHIHQRSLQLGNWFIGLYGDFAFDRSSIHAGYVDPMYGPVQYKEIDRRPLLATGMNIEYRPRKKPFAFNFQVGKNFLDSLAADHAGGIVARAAVNESASSIGRMFKKIL
jgi:hypothetical protein